MHVWENSGTSRSLLDVADRLIVGIDPPEGFNLFMCELSQTVLDYFVVSHITIPGLPSSLH